MASSKLTWGHGEGRAGGQSGGGLVENFCLIGTPLPPIDAKRDANEYKPAWQQEAYDEQGRRRFHGAFTGGWSAGYFNTVGSKDGWVPSSFRSTRRERKGESGGQRNAPVQSVDDFMDEEDRADLLQSRGALQYKDPSDSHAHPDPLLGALGGEPGVSAGSSSLSTTGNDNDLGARVLQQMGWKRGEGIGVDITRSARRQRQALLGLPIEKTESGLEGDLVPPPDTPLPQASFKPSGRYGLGWDEESNPKPSTLAELLQRERGGVKGNGQKSIRQGGFGIGALENDSDGEDEVYEHEQDIGVSSLHIRRKTDKPHVSRLLPNVTNSTMSTADDQNTWHDGAPMIAGFVISSREQEAPSWYAAPTVPLGWQPDPSRVWNLAEIRSTIDDISDVDGGLNAKARASLLGEARAPGPPPVMTDYLSARSKERETSPKTGSEATDDTPHLAIDVARAALRGFMPFAEDPEKQHRYRTYLESQAQLDGASGNRDREPRRDEARRHELNEFAKSAAIFKPLSYVMADRFQSARTPTMEAVKHAGLHRPERAKPTAEAEVAGDVAITSPQRYARQGMFGPQTTRTRKTWKPARLLCKRFDVPSPYPEEEQADDDAESHLEPERTAQRPASKSSVNVRWEESKRQLQHLALQNAKERPAQHKEQHASTTKAELREELDLSQIGLGEKVKEDDEQNTALRPSLDTFRAIFGEEPASSSEATGQVSSEKDSPVIEEATRLTFIPRKRHTGLSGGKEAQTSGHEGDRKRAKKKEKRTPRGTLTFDLDDEG